MDNLTISKIHIKNFRSIQDSTINLKKESILVGKNNIGKTSIIDIFSSINNIKITDFNIKLLERIIENKNSPDKLTTDDSLEFEITYEWKNLSIDYWELLSNISNNGKTTVLVKFSIPKENYQLIQNISDVNDLLNLFTRDIYIGSEDDFKNERQQYVTASNSLIHKLIPNLYNLDTIQPGNILLYPIKAFRYVDSGKESNQETTANQFSDEVTNLILSNESGKNALNDIQKKIDEDVQPTLGSLQNELKRFSYPKNQKNPLKAILTIDKWIESPTVRIAQVFDKLQGFELPLNAQGLGYQNIYNIIARINNLFSKMAKNNLKIQYF
ncbi:AAA family ATPase [Companilactobacillus pabuli]|jgi:predicted ATP-dependent endonuclease of OLD family|uniref:ATP-binding protein n=1 Tax=Companilactobacillus pabuli TaxID=2714036 RepID=A0A7L7KXH8_9LACO|nr:AAA family ATPase [Companilactobacillus pabuli]AKP02320.1 hypothetical protein ABB45_01055 [Companilactobacillus farciminis]AKS50616.1 hypothetical protein ABB44_01055 [Companilactobacillus farciminis]MDG5113722.1 AAA family ATPase [Companilactobacillus pabuli]QMT84493.1 ATP-binding protein [Companilactobacillus pabuli]